MKSTTERCLALCDSRDEAWQELQAYRRKLIEHGAAQAFGLSVRRQAGSWGVWIKRREF